MSQWNLAGAVLLDQTMVSDASRLLQKVPDGVAFPTYLERAGLDPVLAELLARNQNSWPVTNAERLMSLSSLCDAIVLYDRLYVLACQLPVDAEELVLRNELFDLGIVEEIDVSEHRDAIADELAGFFGAAKDSGDGDAHRSGMASAAVREVIRSGLAYEDDSSAEYGRVRTMVDAFRDELEGTTVGGLMGTPETAVATADPLLSLGRKIMDHIAYFGSGAVFGGISGLRTFVYWRLSARLNAPFYSSCRRLPAYHAIRSHVDRTVREQAYSAVAKAFNATVTEVYETERDVPVYLPPALAIFLDELREEGDVGRALVKVRTHYQPLREALRDLQEKSVAEGSLRELRKSRQQFAKVISTLATHPGDRTDAVLNNMVDLLPDVVQAGVNPLDLQSYGKSLVQKPVTWLREWWLRRPYRLMFKLRDRALNLARYDGLLFDTVGLKISPDEFREFGSIYNNYLNSFNAFQSPRRPGAITAAGEETA